MTEPERARLPLGARGAPAFLGELLFLCVFGGGSALAVANIKYVETGIFGLIVSYAWITISVAQLCFAVLSVYSSYSGLFDYTLDKVEVFIDERCLEFDDQDAKLRIKLGVLGFEAPRLSIKASNLVEIKYFLGQTSYMSGKDMGDASVVIVYRTRVCFFWERERLYFISMRGSLLEAEAQFKHLIGFLKELGFSTNALEPSVEATRSPARREGERARVSWRERSA